MFDATFFNIFDATFFNIFDATFKKSGLVAALYLGN